MTRVARALLFLAAALVIPGCGGYEPLQPLIGEYDPATSSIRACDSGREYHVITGSDGAAQFIRRTREAGAGHDEILLGQFSGFVTCLYPWDCLCGRDDTFNVDEVVSLRRARCPAPAAPTGD